MREEPVDALGRGWGGHDVAAVAAADRVGEERPDVHGVTGIEVVDGTFSGGCRHHESGHGKGVSVHATATAEAASERRIVARRRIWRVTVIAVPPGTGRP
jgi:hypothetical protein